MRYRVVLAAALSATVVFLSLSVCRAADEPGTVKWAFNTGSFVDSSPAIGPNGTVYIDCHNKVYALDGQTGAQKWVLAASGIVASSPTVGPDGAIYVGSNDDKVYALDGKTGQEKWVFKTGAPTQSSPAVGPDSMVYVGSNDDKVYALDGKTGQEKWVFKTGGPIQLSPAVGPDGTVYVGSADGNLYALDGKTGKKMWEFKTEGPVESTPSVGPDSIIYVGSDDDNVYAISGKTGVQKWAFRTGGRVNSSPHIGLDGFVYVGSADNNIYALNGRTGTQEWSFETDTRPFPSAVAIGSGGVVYVGSYDRHVYALDRTTGEKRWEFATDSGGACPSVGPDGTVYIAVDHKVYAITGDRGGPSHLSSHSARSQPVSVPASPPAKSAPVPIFPSAAYLRANHPRLQDEIGSLRQAHFPMTFADLRPPDAAPGQNAGPDYAQMYKPTPKDWPWAKLEDLSDAIRSKPGPLTPDQDQQIQKVFTDCRDVFELLHRAALKPAYVFPASDYDYLNFITNIGITSEPRNAVRILSEESYLLARQGKYDDAIKTQALCFRIADQCASVHTLIAYLSAAACTGMARKGLRNILDLSGGNTVIAREVEDVIAHGHAHLNLAWAVEGEVPQNIQLLSDLRTDWANTLKATLRATALSPAAKKPHEDPPLNLLEPMILSARTDPRMQEVINATVDGMGAEELHYQRALVHDLNQPEQKRVAAVAATMKELKDRAAVALTHHDPCFGLALMTVPVEAECVNRGLLEIAGNRVLLCGAAVVLYHGEHNTYPEHLSQAISPVPHDPFTGDPLRYRREKDGFVVYSVGPTGQFNGDPTSGPKSWLNAAFRYPTALPPDIKR